MENNSNTNIHAQYLEAMGIQIWVRRHVPITDESSPEPVSLTTAAKSLINSSESTDYVTSASSFPARLSLTNDNQTSQPTVSPENSLAPKPHVAQELPSTPETKIDWGTLQKQVVTCTACELAKTRTNTVFGVGNQQADLMLIGEAPGADEDAQGEPFVGRAGKLLNNMLYAIGLTREDVYIANVIKCRPPQNRNPNPQELTHCNTFLQQQITLIKPKLIVAVGRVSAQYLLATQTTIGKLRGQLFEYGIDKIPLIATYHPAYLLRRPTEKRQSWLDLQFIVKTITEL